MRFLLPIVLVLAALYLTACNDDSCYDNGSSLPLAAFYLGNSQQTITGLTIMGIGAPGDSLLADSSALKEVYLPLRASVGTTRYAISRWVGAGTPMAQQLHDTLTLDYEPIAYFHSAECGAMYNFNLHDVRCTINGIDSVVVITPLVTNSRTPALRIYFTNFSL
ncbi:MAG: hypothetical protein IIZ44_09395 [Muribaculaceae bacterium]|jgi:hypothetical protein|nr:hypothetical protein [Muribaculaceae bacterium]